MESKATTSTTGGSRCMVLVVCVISLLACALSPVAGMSMPSACSACSLVMQPLQKRLDEEKIGEKLIDLRNRLDPHGQRQGKQIEYKNSELRVETLLDDLCAGEFKNVSFVQSDPKPATDGSLKSVWRSVSEKARKGKNRGYHEKQQRKFEGYCAFLFDEYEDEVTKIIRQFEKGKGISVVDQFCADFIKVCERTTPATETKNDDDAEL